MERSLIWSAIALGGVGWIVCMLAHWDANYKSRKFTLVWDKLHPAAGGMACALPILIFLATLPSKAPFSSGHGLGIGFLLGGISALLGCLPAVTSRQTTQSLKNATTLTSGMWLSCAAAAIAVLWNPDVRVDILVSLAIGHCAISAILLTQLNRDEDFNLAAPPIILSTLFNIALMATAVMAVYRGDDSLSAIRWCGAAILMGLCAPIAILIAAIPLAHLARPFARFRGSAAIATAAGIAIKSPEKRGLAQVVLTSIAAVAISTLLVRVISGRISEPRAWQVMLLGLGTSTIVALLIAEEDRRTQNDLTSIHYSGLAMLAIMGSGYLSFIWLHGFGQGLFALSMICFAGIWATFDLSQSHTDKENMHRRTNRFAALLAIAVIWALNKVIHDRYGAELRFAGLSEQFALLGFVLGMVLPAICASISQPERNANGFSRMLRLTLAAGLIIAIPAVAMMLWKSKILFAMVAGLSLSATGLALRGSNALTQMKANISTTIWSLAGMLALCQFSDRWNHASQLTRAEKIHAIEGIALVAIVLLIAAESIGKSKAILTPLKEGAIQ